MITAAQIESKWAFDLAALMRGSESI